MFFQCWEQSESNYPAKMTRQLLGLKQPLQTKECKQVTGFQTWMIWIIHSVLSCQKWTPCISQSFLQAMQATQMRLD